MLKEQMMKLKEKIIKQDNEGNNKRKIENLVVFIIILIITIIVINSIWNTQKENTKSNEDTNTKVLAQTQEDNTSQTSQNDELTQKLKSILSKINGVGEVEVLLTYSQSSQTVAMYNEDSSKSDTEESDNRWRNKKSI